MIVVDASALLAVVLGEPLADACIGALAAEDDLLISAVTLAEAMIVASRKDKLDSAERFISGLYLQVVDATEVRALTAAESYRRWGKGFHKAKLHFGDCFAYALAIERDCPLLFIGDDFAKTDVRSALG